MAERILIILGSLIIAILVTLGVMEYEQEYEILIGILSISGFTIMIIQFIKYYKE